ncbi:MAG: polyprenyl synthetase family protein [Actinomycetota bacterium]|nr:polyprenyl synthetase family protein [Actinomycetota bacterium]
MTQRQVPAPPADPPTLVPAQSAPGPSLLHLDGRLRQFAAQVDQEINAVLHAEVHDAWMRGAISYHFGWADTRFEQLPPEQWSPGGKKLRPTLALLCHHGAAGAGGASSSQPLAFAAAVELVHNFSLIHDDIQDGDRLRRGRPTIWSICGAAQAINVGDTLHALAYLCLARLPGRDIDDHRSATVVAALARGVVDMTVGQRRDMAYETGCDVDVETYLEMIAGKTAALMACATYGGAVLALGSGKSTAETVARFREFGHHLGLGFQIRDDILGVWGAESETGKPTGSDLRRRKMSLPVIVAFQTAPPEVRDRLVAIFSQHGELTGDQENYIRRVLDDCHAQAIAQSLVETHGQQASRALTDIVAATDTAGSNPFLGDLEQLTASLTTRAH